MDERYEMTIKSSYHKDIKAAVKGKDMAFALHEILINLPKAMKQQYETCDEVDPEDMIDSYAQEIRNIAEENGIMIDDLIE